MSINFKDPLIIKQLIMDHYEFPRHHKLRNEASYRKKHMAAESCIDDITVEIKFDGDKIQDLGFDGKACTISTASTSMLCELIVGKSISEALSILKEYENMVALRPFDAGMLGEAVAFEGVGKQANRVSCALIGWQGLIDLIREELTRNS